MIRSRFAPIALGLMASAAAPVIAVAAPAATAFNIPAGSLNNALLTYAAQSHRQVLFNADAVSGLSTSGLKGRFGDDEALDRLLAGSGITYDHTGPNVVVLKRPRATGPVATASGADALPATNPDTAELAPVVVTGSQIRRVQAISPLLTISRDSMDRQGQPTVADLLQALPQNLGGVATPASQVLNTDRIGENVTGATGVNLRGLGPSATLVLIDGHRMAGSGVHGDFADVSAIPTSAVDHVEVLLDGASALYGSDAVGGVVNLILRKNFEGAETRVLEGFTADGGARETQIGQTFGKSWRTGNLTLALEYDGRDALRGDQRPYTATADLTTFGGTDFRSYYAHPGNIMVVDPTTGSYVSAWAIPSGQNGTGLTPSSFLAGQTNLSDQREGADTIPNQQRYSVYANLTQQLGDRLTFNGNVRYSDRRFAYKLDQAVTLFQVTSKNPYFVSPNGTSSEVIAYSFADELGGLLNTGSAQNVGATGTLSFDLGRGWQADLSGEFAEEVDHRDENHRLNTAFLNEALGTSADDPHTTYSAVRDGYFNPFGDGGANSQTVLDFINSGYYHTIDHSQVTTVNLKVDGTVFTLPGGPWKLAFGGQVRRETFSDLSISMASHDTPTTTLTGPYDRLVTAAFGELRAPIVGPDNAVPGIQRLELSIAGRIEHYPTTGTTANPKLGLLWAPVAGVKLRATWGTSFRAPSLTDAYAPEDIGPAFLPQGSATKLVLLLDGGNANLKPETATSYTVGVDLSPPQIPVLTLSATWFDTHFTNQIAVPVSDDIYNALSSPAYAPFVTAIAPSNAADVAKVSALLAQSNSPNAALFPASSYAYIVDARWVNTGGLTVRGIDLQGTYDLRLGDDHLIFAGNASILVDYLRQVTPASTPISLLDTGGEPVSFRGRGSTTWRHGPFETTFALNYVSAYHDTSGRAVSSWTTADLQLLWRPQTAGPLARTTVALNIQNLADAAPPFFNAPQGVGYDPANANPLGRVMSLQITKRW